jgi:hypothetical protein
MDVDAPGFEADFSTFRDVIRELERRLGALIMQVRMSNTCVAGLLQTGACSAALI